MTIQINGTSGISGVDGSAATPAFQGTDTNTGISFGADTVNINTGGTTRATVDSSGRLLVGTTSSSAVTSIVAQGNSTNTAGAGVLSLARGTSSISSGNQLGIIDFTDSSDNRFARIEAVADAATGAGDYPGRLVFSTTADGASSPTERMRIDSTGNIYFDYARSQVNYGGVLWAPAVSNAMVQYTGSSTTSGISLIVFRNPNGIVGSISTSGSATTYSTSSDYRLKENITPVTDGIARLQQLKPSRFNFIADPKTNVDGFIAHEVQAVVPEAVFGEKDAVDENGDIAPQGIDQSKLVPLLTAALQEAIAKIESLETRLTALEGGNP